MIAQQINYVGGFPLAGIPGTSGKTTPTATKLNNRQIFMWVSKPANPKTAGYEINATTFSTSAFNNPVTGYFAQFGSVSDPLQDPNANTMVQVAGDLSVIQNHEFLVRTMSFRHFSVQSSVAITQTAIDASLSEQNSAIPQAKFDQSPMVDWAKNYFRPQVLISGQNIYNGLDTVIATQQVGTSTILDGMKAFGMPLPLFDSPNAYVPKTSAQTFTVSAGCYLPVATDTNTVVYQQYPLIAMAEILY